MRVNNNNSSNDNINNDDDNNNDFDNLGRVVQSWVKVTHG